MESATGTKANIFDNKKTLKLSPLHSSGNINETLSDDCMMNTSSFSAAVMFESNSSYPSINKAIFTVLLPSSEILVVNIAACQLINYSTDELCSMKLEDLVHKSYIHKFQNLVQKFLEDFNQVSYHNGKLMELVRKDGETILVFLFLKNVDNPQKCLAIAELLDRKTGMISIDENGKILTCDEEVALIFQYDSSEVVGFTISSLLPAIDLSKKSDDYYEQSNQQRITGLTKNGEVFPVSLTIMNNPNSEIFKIVIWAYTGLTGLILLNKKLLVKDFNYLVKILFGFSRKKIINQPIFNLIPTFCKDIKLQRSGKGQNGMCNFVNESSLSGRHEKNDVDNESFKTEISGLDDNMHNLRLSAASLSPNSFLNSAKNCNGSYKDLSNESENSLNSLLEVNFEQKNEGETSGHRKHKINYQAANMEKLYNKLEQKEFEFNNENLIEGKFLGRGKHSDGSFFDIKYMVRMIALGEELCCWVWLAKDVYKLLEINRGILTNGTLTSVDDSHNKDSFCVEQCTRPSTASIISQCDDHLTAGEYSKCYTNIRQIGKGAFGYVKMAFRNSDGLLVVTKFIKKQKINIRSWVFHSNLNMKIPLEISLLTTLQHPNIVKVLDVFHNDSFVQLVMEKHGAGFDLFEFIDRRPKCDEKLKSYIFRQIISAVYYLNSLGILHRDIKDENVIINEKFEIKLIDFGSATFMPPDETFSKFYGTVEYCSPEVLQGNSYKGPELEIWALGVTLYVLTFENNPFYNIEEIIKGQFSIPTPISEELNDLLHKMLDKNIETRIAIEKVVEHPWINQPVCVENYRFDEVVRCYDDEAFPPKYVYEIHSEELYSRITSLGDSDQILDTNNSNNSLQNIPIEELGDLDDNFPEAQKVLENALTGAKINVPPVMLSSTPVPKKNDRPTFGLHKQLENSLKLDNWSPRSSNSNLTDNELCENDNALRIFGESSIQPNNLDEDLTVEDIEEDNELDIKVNFEKNIHLERNNIIEINSSKCIDDYSSKQKSCYIKECNIFANDADVVDDDVNDDGE